MKKTIVKPAVAAFEVTGRCPLKCRHCRAAAVADGADPLDTAACKALLKGLADYSCCVLIFTGGEPMMRDDIFELVAYSRSIGLRPVMATCGERLDRDAMERLKDAGLLSFSFSLDGADAASHDAFRQRDGAFELVMQAVKTAKEVGIRFQINTTLTRLNADAMDDIAALAVKLGAACWNPFILVPVGRGEAIRELLFTPDEYESVLGRLAELKASLPIEMRLTCGPQFARVVRQKKLPNADKVPGCLAATEFVFISRRGDVQTCGFLEQSAGNLVEAGFDFGRVWEQSPLLCGLRDHDRYGGVCAACGYLAVCRGCRARALAVRGDAFAEDPICKFTNRQSSIANRQLKILSAVQEPLPLCEHPFEAMAAQLGLTERQLLDGIVQLKADGLIRRYRAQLRYRALGRVAALCAAAVPPERIEHIAAQVSTLSGVSHNYQRDGKLNLWFTLQGRSMEEVESVLSGFRRDFGIAFYSFPAETVYKLDVKFDPAGPNADWFVPRNPVHPQAAFEVAVPHPSSIVYCQSPLTPEEKAALTAIQAELPLVPRPFAQLLGDVPLSALGSLADKGILGKIAAVLDYPRLGYRANTMLCAVVAVDRIDAVGAALSQIPAVTHGYRRRAYPDWPYTLYAMLHADTLDRIAAFVRDFCGAHCIADYQLLPTVREFKKSPVPVIFQ